MDDRVTPPRAIGPWDLPPPQPKMIHPPGWFFGVLPNLVCTLLMPVAMGLSLITGRIVGVWSWDCNRGRFVLFLLMGKRRR